MRIKTWQLYTLITTLFWGVWGAFIEIPEKNGFPATLGYAVWALTMIPCAIVALSVTGWKINTDARSVVSGGIVGLSGAGGQLILFQALRDGPAYIVFPIISLYPVITVLLSVLYLNERTNRKHWIGIGIALLAILLLSYMPPSATHARGWQWLILAIGVFLLWGVQAFVMKRANATMSAESIFFYMMISGVILIPAALWMTNWNMPVNWGWKGPGLAVVIQVLNAIGALTLVYALRYGKAIIVTPATALAPVITIILSLLLYGVIPSFVIITGLCLAVIAIYLLAE
ncbi:DMT family transporter [Chitinophaga sp.]|uniref:DMT family transporter n=1 Tax=Chitinophaga sp. TaxID=1869181 RepID=UPI00261718D8|nr:DMT family transporter [uncultured Chitinophaga sp.]